jgi:RNA polymerase sigma-70 factor, ECF subfamily
MAMSVLAPSDRPARQGESRPNGWLSAGAGARNRRVSNRTGTIPRTRVCRAGALLPWVVGYASINLIHRVPVSNDCARMPTTLKQDLIALLPRLRRFAFTIARSAADADDLVQEACIRALTRQDQWNPAQPLDRWVFRILRNVWIDEVRKRQVRTGQGQIPAEDASELISVDTGEARFAERELHKKITEMPDELGLVVLVVSVEGYSYKEAAE